ncbi:hypothetical protein KUTeg_023726 [Tegillarca granosa]|uniref:Endoplasmic reticulum vesicle transporter C-terminal domain-containing protein n=1 Tax=Tegillarca granosa TaxID=220873 RepID=A0ABQ9E7C5_TEGGR|nr:hypothetical protein KUTeg_023726 [Tegillarca granosa]
MRRLNAVANRKQALKVVKELDAFPKVPDDFKETSASGGGGIGADVLDLSGQDTSFSGELQLDNVYFDLSPNQRKYHRLIVEINSYLREEYHAIQDVMWMSREASSYRKGMPEREDRPNRETDACRIHGTLEVKKVAGNFHVTAGK